HRLLVITKGDLRDQERKVAKSGLVGHFSGIEIVSEKDAGTYSRILKRHSIAPERFVMIGNSLKSDILPILDLGASGVYIPYHLTWGHERVDQLPTAEGRFFQLKTVREVPGAIGKLRAKS
ncbi:MAG TPA: HAD family hydrolase, partial [Opitutaceae bacterium]|nr:HAD family hydrolase [Opitutaceae bacterium]